MHMAGHSDMTCLPGAWDPSMCSHDCPCPTPAATSPWRTTRPPLPAVTQWCCLPTTRITTSGQQSSSTHHAVLAMPQVRNLALQQVRTIWHFMLTIACRYAESYGTCILHDRMVMDSWQASPNVGALCGAAEHTHMQSHQQHGLVDNAWQRSQFVFGVPDASSRHL